MSDAVFVECLFDLSDRYTLPHTSPERGHIERQMISEVRGKLGKQQDRYTKPGSKLALVEQITLRKATPVPVSPLPVAARPVLFQGNVKVHWEDGNLCAESMDVITRLEAGCKYKYLRTAGFNSKSEYPTSSSDSQEIDEIVSAITAKYS